MDIPSQEVTTIAAILIAICALAIAVVGRAALDPYTRDQEVGPSSAWFPLRSPPRPLDPIRVESGADVCGTPACARTAGGDPGAAREGVPVCQNAGGNHPLRDRHTADEQSLCG
jgi:hypothetical protein